MFLKNKNILYEVKHICLFESKFQSRIIYLSEYKKEEIHWSAQKKCFNVLQNALAFSARAYYSHGCQDYDDNGTNYNHSHAGHVAPSLVVSKKGFQSSAPGPVFGVTPTPTIVLRPGNLKIIKLFRKELSSTNRVRVKACM